jgi:hypothetical protein
MNHEYGTSRERRIAPSPLRSPFLGFYRLGPNSKANDFNGLMSAGLSRALNRHQPAHRLFVQSQAHTSTRLAAQAASSATVSAICRRSQGVWSVVLMACKTSGDSGRGVSGNIFRGIQDSFTTQGLTAGRGWPGFPRNPESAPVGQQQSPRAVKPNAIARVRMVWGAVQCPTRCFAVRPS